MGLVVADRGLGRARMKRVSTKGSDRFGGPAGFTLTELLAVVAVMTALLGLGAAVLMSGRGRSGGQTAEAVVAGALTRARAQAVAGGRETGVVLLAYDCPLAEGAGRLLVLVEFGAQSEAAAQVLGRAEVLPDGRVFLDQAASGAQRAGVFDQPERLEVSYQGQRVSGPFLRFDRRGVVVHPPVGATLDLLVGPGVVRGGRVVSSARGLTGEAAFERIRVGRLNGRSRVIEE